MSSNISPPLERPTFSRSISASSHMTQSSNSVSVSLSRRKDKPRLYLALFTRGGPTSTYSSQLTCDSSHWAILLGPKTPSRAQGGTVYQIIHATSRGAPYYYEESDLDNTPHQSRNILVRITLAKVLNEPRIQSLLRSIPVPGTNPTSSSFDTQYAPAEEGSEYPDSAFTCLTWVKAAYKILTTTNNHEKILKSYIGPQDWSEVETCARNYVRRKRTQGRFQSSDNAFWNPEEIPTWNFWENRETTD